jgi:hypothetical protein
MLLPPGGADALADALVGRSFADYPVVAAGGLSSPGNYLLAGVAPGAADIAARVVQATGAPFEGFLVERGLGEKLDTTASEVTLTLVPAVAVTINVRSSVTGDRLDPEVTRRTAGVEGEFPVEMATPLRSGSAEVAVGQSYWLPLDDRRHVLRFTLDGYEEAALDLPNLRSQEQYTALLAVGPITLLAHPFDVAMRPTATGENGSFYVVFEPPLDGRVALVGRDASGAQRFVKHIEAADREGRWAVEDVPVGEYAVSVLATGMVPATLPRVVVARGLKDTYRVTLTPGGGLALRVTDGEGQLLDKVHLVLKDQGGTEIDVHVLSHVSEGRAFLSVNYLPSSASARADSGLAPGFYEIAVYREGFDIGRKSFEVRGTAVAEVEIALAKAAK